MLALEKILNCHIAHNTPFSKKYLTTVLQWRIWVITSFAFTIYFVDDIPNKKIECRIFANALNNVCSPLFMHYTSYVDDIVKDPGGSFQGPMYLYQMIKRYFGKINLTLPSPQFSILL